MSKAWQAIRLGDAVREEREAVGTFDGSGLPVLGVTNVAGVSHTGIEASEDRSKYLRLRPGRFVYNPYRVNVGSIGLSTDKQDGICSPAYVVFAPTDRIDPHFLRFFLKSGRGHQLINFHGNRGTVRGALRFDDLCKIEIPLPPLTEQRRVVAHIEELARRIQEARGLRQQAMEAAEALWASLLTKTLSHTDTVVPHDALPDADQAVRRGVVSPVLPSAAAAKWQIPRGWRRVSVAELLQRGLLLDVKDGNHGANHPRSAEFVEHGTPFLMASDLHDGKVQWNSASRLGPETISRLKVGFASRGDVFFTHKASIGKTAIADRDCILSPQVTYYRCNPAFIEPRWLRAFLGSQLFLLQLSDIQSQTTRDFVSIGKQYQQFILLPPLSEQHRIAEELDSLQAQVESLKRVQAETAAKLDALLPAILDRAFKGELV